MGIRQMLADYSPFNEQEVKDRELMLCYLDQFDDLFKRENEFAHFTASSWVVNRDRTKVLMVYHNIYRSWSWIGGHMDGETDFLATAIRETKEETGIEQVQPVSEELFSLEILSVDGHVKNGKQVGTHVHLNLTYLLEADETQDTSIKPDENSGVAWMGLEEALSKCTEPYMKGIYAKLNDKLNRMQ
ncbi:NUDIX hydrolase [Trichococcus shcherbakoviae]|uniref:Nudix hydrolase domain-containing protein n=1 Tax=Trichococcus shcherbakoviae TaxID=2094020 RepID=A0A383TCH2_9LACT|nr:NUDIX hydrolase [Trichococcus shcherbakoviae]SYZ77379.1 Hypothetical protein TART1_0148 [Trichococcus shcherbakoviae]